MHNVFYFRYLNKIGGIESFFYYLAKKYKDYDITIYYTDGDMAQVNRLAKYVRVKKYKGEKIKCERIFFNFNLDIIENVEADEYIQIAHGDYKAMGIKPNTHPKLTRFLGVSKQVCKTYKEVTGFDTELAYNPIMLDEPKKVLNLISATRLTAEKGKQRMIKFAEILDKANVPYLWTVFTDDVNAIVNPNIVYMKPRLDIVNYIANADYLIQLSDNEGYCYSVVEALTVGTPVIVTDVPVFREIGVNKRNGFILDFDLQNVPVEEIYAGVNDFKFTPKKDSWGNLLVKSKSTYAEELKELVKVKATQQYYDIDRQTEVKKGDEYLVTRARAEYLLENNVIEILGGV